jgi:ribosome-binding protein aMBF1 (putative translation factor)
MLTLNGKKSGRTYRAHRIAWELTKGQIPDGAVICHRCDNPRCCNPDHLFVGTKADNSADMTSKGRHRTDPRQGEKHGMHKLTEGVVLQIRDAYAAGGATQTALAERFGMSVSQINNIVNRRHWRHI